MDNGRRLLANWGTVVVVDPRRLLPHLIAVTALVVLGTGAAVVLRGDDESARRRSVATSTAPAAAEVPRSAERAVLADWDRRRARAWARGSVSALRDLYVPGSAAGRADARMLRAYAQRGLSVRGLETQVLKLEVRVATPRRLALTVTDRVVGGEVVGAERVHLPTDRPTTRRVTFRKVAGKWLVAGVRR